MIESMSELYKLGLVVFAVLLVGVGLSLLRQPRVAGYLVVGMLLGPHLLGIAPGHELAEFLSEIGVVLLLFFIGMEVSIERLIRGWKVSVVGTLLQILMSIGWAWLLSLWYAWDVGDIILVGFMISLSSTAVVLTMLQNWKELESQVGQDVLGILLVQDLMVVPMLIVLGLLGGDKPSAFSVGLEVIGGILICGLIAWAVIKGRINVPQPSLIREDAELELFTALTVCLGFAIISALFGLSAALGAFAAGILVTAAGLTDRAHLHLQPFKHVFLALFFVSIGMLVDIPYILDHWQEACWLVLLILLTNTLINSVVVRFGRRPWRDCLYAGVLLSQIGEFSFVLVAVGAASGIMSEPQHRLAYAVIALSLIVSPFWIGLGKHWLRMPSLQMSHG